MATESGNLPPLNPIFEQLSQALEKQKAENPAPPTPRDPAEQDRLARRRAYKRGYNAQWRKDHPDRAKEIGRNAARKRRATEQGREQINNNLREWRKGKRDERIRVRALTVENWGDLPPLPPVFLRLSEALAKQQTAPAGETGIFPEPEGRPGSPQSPAPDRPRSTRGRRTP